MKVAVIRTREGQIVFAETDAIRYLVGSHVQLTSEPGTFLDTISGGELLGWTGIPLVDEAGIEIPYDDQGRRIDLSGDGTGTALPPIAQDLVSGDVQARVDFKPEPPMTGAQFLADTDRMAEIDVLSPEERAVEEMSPETAEAIVDFALDDAVARGHLSPSMRDAMTDHAEFCDDDCKPPMISTTEEMRSIENNKPFVLDELKPLTQEQIDAALPADYLQALRDEYGPVAAATSTPDEYLDPTWISGEHISFNNDGSPRPLRPPTY